jgi:MFS family permease
LISLVGTWMQQIAQGWLILQLTNDPVALGVAAACQFTPVICFGLFGGVLADALPKRATLLAANTASLCLAFGLGLLVASGHVQVWHVYLFAVLLGTVSSVEMPVRQAFVVEMVGREDVPNAVGLNSAVFNGSRIVGPALAGIVIGLVGIVTCFFLNGASYLGALAGLALIRPAELTPGPRASLERSARVVFARLAEGLRYVAGTPTVRLAVGVLGTVATVGLNFGVLIPILARDVLGGGAETYGFLMAASGVGSLGAALMIAFAGRTTLRLLVGGAAVIGLALIAVGLSRSIPVTLVLMVILGWGVIAMAATANTLIQLTVPDELRGRVMSVYVTVFAGSTPVGGLVSGGIAGVAGVQAALVLGGILSLAVAGVAATRVPGLLGPRPAIRPGDFG